MLTPPSPGSTHSVVVVEFLQASLSGLGEPLKELVASISRKDESGQPRWTTAQGRKVADQVIEHQDFVPKLLSALKTLKDREQADGLLVLAWLATASKDVILQVSEAQVRSAMMLLTKSDDAYPDASASSPLALL